MKFVTLLCAQRGKKNYRGFSVSELIKTNPLPSCLQANFHAHPLENIFSSFMHGLPISGRLPKTKIKSSRKLSRTYLGVILFPQLGVSIENTVKLLKSEQNRLIFSVKKWKIETILPKNQRLYWNRASWRVSFHRRAIRGTTPQWPPMLCLPECGFTVIGIAHLRSIKHFRYLGTLGT